MRVYRRKGRITRKRIAKKKRRRDRDEKKEIRRKSFIRIEQLESAQK